MIDLMSVYDATESPPPPAPSAGRYDVVVVGAGIGGLVTAALLARAGVKVLVIEAHALGGLAHSFRRNDYVFDPSVHIVADPPLYERLLGHLEVADRVQFITPPSFFTTELPGCRIDAPFGEEAFVEAHAAAVPHEAEGIRAFFATCSRIHHEAHELGSRMSLRDLDGSAGEIPTLMRYRRATVQDVVEEHLHDPLARAVCSASHIYLGTPPSELSFQTFAQMLFSHVIHGAAYVRGGVQELIDAFAVAVEKHGGEVLVGARVTGIGTANGKVTGVTLEDGEEIRAPIVISNADTLQTYEQLVGLDHVPSGEARKLRRLTLSRSAFVLFIASTLDFGAHGGHIVFFQRSLDPERAYLEPPPATPDGMQIAVPSVIDPSVMPKGEHQIVMARVVPYDIGRPWHEVKEEWTNAALGVLEPVFPGLGDNLVFVESSTPHAIERFTSNRRGAIYGWAVTPGQTGGKRPAQVTGIDGLYLVGMWTGAGTGFVRSVTSGLSAAQAVLSEIGSNVVVPRVMS